MKINGVNPYHDFIIEPKDRSSRTDQTVKLKIENKNFSQSKLNGDSASLSQSERDFFVNMFPDNSEQIRKHVLFNRQGRVETLNTTAKGSLFDGVA